MEEARDGIRQDVVCGLHQVSLFVSFLFAIQCMHKANAKARVLSMFSLGLKGYFLCCKGYICSVIIGVKLDKSDGLANVLMANIYATTGM